MHGLVKGSLLVTALLAAPASAASWSVGSHLSGGSITDGPNDGSTAVFAFPSNALMYQPGLRIAFGDDRHANELQFDGGALIIDQAGSTLSLVAVSLGYQRVFLPDAVVAPFANLCVGLMREGGAAVTSSATSVGVGVGVRKLARDRHGALRLEVRLDQLEGDDAFGRPDLRTLGLRAGFDLWL